MRSEHETAPRAQGLILSYSEITNPGGRTTNEDALRSMEQDGLYCFVVSDGVGGDAAGSIASGLVVDGVIHRFSEEACVGARALRSYVDWAATAVAQRKAADKQLEQMKATVAAVLIDTRNRSAAWAHLGDTRIYHFRNRKVHKVTRDHSLIQQLVDAGYCHFNESRTHQQRNALYGAIGDTEGVGAEVVVDEVRLVAGDAFLVCSDGFWEWITEAEMEDIAAFVHAPAEWLCAMRAVVDRNAGSSTRPRDNYTAITILLDEPVGWSSLSGPSHAART